MGASHLFVNLLFPLSVLFWKMQKHLSPNWASTTSDDCVFPARSDQRSFRGISIPISTSRNERKYEDIIIIDVTVLTFQTHLLFHLVKAEIFLSERLLRFPLEIHIESHRPSSLFVPLLVVPTSPNLHSAFSGYSKAKSAVSLALDS